MDCRFGRYKTHYPQIPLNTNYMISAFLHHLILISLCKKRNLLTCQIAQIFSKPTADRAAGSIAHFGAHCTAAKSWCRSSLIQSKCSSVSMIFEWHFKFTWPLTTASQAATNIAFLCMEQLRTRIAIPYFVSISSIYRCQHFNLGEFLINDNLVDFIQIINDVCFCTPVTTWLYFMVSNNSIKMWIVVRAVWISWVMGRTFYWSAELVMKFGIRAWVVIIRW